MSSKIADSSSVEDVNVFQAEHDVQIELLRALEDAVSRQRPSEELEAIFKQLMDYTNVHFLSEQLLMRMYAYPDYAQHEQRHTQLMERTGVVRESLSDGDRELTLTTLRQLKERILGHIEHDDAALANYIQTIYKRV